MWGLLLPLNRKVAEQDLGVTGVPLSVQPSMPYRHVWVEKEVATHSSVLAWRTPGKGEPGGLPSMGSHRVGHD